MAKIVVDHSELGATAKVIETYVELIQRKYKSADGEVRYMTSAWAGNDETKFIQQWNKINDPGTATRGMIEDYSTYAKNLKAAEQLYKDAQADAVNSANWLPKW